MDSERGVSEDSFDVGGKDTVEVSLFGQSSPDRMLNELRLEHMGGFTTVDVASCSIQDLAFFGDLFINPSHTFADFFFSVVASPFFILLLFIFNFNGEKWWLL